MRNNFVNGCYGEAHSVMNFLLIWLSVFDAEIEHFQRVHHPLDPTAESIAVHPNFYFQKM